jgi:hypothetical protein
MKAINPFKSIQITPPFGGVLVSAVSLLTVFILVSEGIIRLGVHSSLWSEPLMGTVNAELDIKIQMLDKIDNTERIECIFLGSSQFDSAVNPVWFSEEVEIRTGKNIKCFNFSLGTLTAGPAGTVAYMLNERYHPGLIIVGLSARDFSRDFGELTRPLKEDSWMKAQSGDPNLSGWITQNSRFFRLLNQLRNYFNPDYLDFHNRLKRDLMPDGFLNLTGNNLELDTENFIPKFGLLADDLNGLDELINLKNRGVQIVFVEVPVHPDFLPVYIEADRAAYEKKFRQPIIEKIEARVPFLLTQEVMEQSVDNKGWNDPKHLNSKGAEIFSRWLAETLVNEGLLKGFH